MLHLTDYLCKFFDYRLLLGGMPHDKKSIRGLIEVTLFQYVCYVIEGIPRMGCWEHVKRKEFLLFKTSDRNIAIVKVDKVALVVSVRGMVAKKWQEGGGVMLKRRVPQVSGKKRMHFFIHLVNDVIPAGGHSIIKHPPVHGMKIILQKLPSAFFIKESRRHKRVSGRDHGYFRAIEGLAEKTKIKN